MARPSGDREWGAAGAGDVGRERDRRVERRMSHVRSVQAVLARHELAAELARLTPERAPALERAVREALAGGAYLAASRAAWARLAADPTLDLRLVLLHRLARRRLAAAVSALDLDADAYDCLAEGWWGRLAAAVLAGVLDDEHRAVLRSPWDRALGGDRGAAGG